MFFPHSCSFACLFLLQQTKYIFVTKYICIRTGVDTYNFEPVLEFQIRPTGPISSNGGQNQENRGKVGQWLRIILNWTSAKGFETNFYLFCFRKFGALNYIDQTSFWHGNRPTFLSPQRYTPRKVCLIFD